MSCYQVLHENWLQLRDTAQKTQLQYWKNTFITLKWNQLATSEQLVLIFIILTISKKGVKSLLFLTKGEGPWKSLVISMRHNLVVPYI